MRKKRMERELNHPHFVGVRLTDIELELLDSGYRTGTSGQESRDPGSVQIRMPAETSGGQGDCASGRSGCRYGRTAKPVGGIWKDWREPESDRTVLQYGRGTFAGYGR